MVHSAQSALQKNEVNLSIDGVNEVFRPFSTFEVSRRVSIKIYEEPLELIH